MGTKKILFLTATRADFGKLKSLIKGIEEVAELEYAIFVTGMHTLSRYGYTVDEVVKAGFRNLHVFMNQITGEPMDLILANTIGGLSRYVHEYQPDMIVVHGDRIEAMAGAIVGMLNNILVAHIEGGEISGTVDGLIRHSVSKMAHLHFVSNQEAAKRLQQLGEDPQTIFIIGSPDIDIMLSTELPSVDLVKKYYEIPFEHCGVVLFHPVTTELDDIYRQVTALVEALVESGRNYVVIYPNNDAGCSDIFTVYKQLEDNPRFRVFPSLRFEYFLSLLQHADFIIGNSSAGIREAPVFGVPCINVGTRQDQRFQHSSAINVPADKGKILQAIHSLQTVTHIEPCLHFGQGESYRLFTEILQSETVWKTNKQKPFKDISF